MISIREALEALADDVRSTLAADAEGERYKTNGEPTNANAGAPNAAQVYTFYYPTHNLYKGWPKVCPCVVLTVGSMSEQGVYACTAALCVADATEADADITESTGAANRYKYKKSTAVNTNTALVKTSLLFTESIYRILMNITRFVVDGINIEFTEPTAPNYPYAASSISFQLHINQSRVRVNPYNDLY